MTLEAALERLGAAAGAATQIGLTDEADGATRVHDAALQRAGFPGSAYVLALAGGTGVGKGVGEVCQLVDYVTVGEVLAQATRRSERQGAVFRWPAPGPG